MPEIETEPYERIRTPTRRADMTTGNSGLSISNGRMRIFSRTANEVCSRVKRVVRNTALTTQPMIMLC